LRRFAGIAIPGLLALPILFSTAVQTRSYLVASDSAYQSDVLQSCLGDFRELHPSLPPQVTLFFLPAFEEGVSDLLSIPPIDRGQLFQLYYPESRIEAVFAHRGGRLPEGMNSRSDVIVLQYADRHLYDVTRYFKSGGRMTLYLLPTSEGKVAPLLKKIPAGGRALYEEYVQLLFADEGARLPEDYATRSDFWVLQYLNGRFSDVTGYYKGRRIDNSLRVVRAIEGVQYSVDRAEFYPDYERFGTPTGAPVFFPTPEEEILTQIGGSTLIAPLRSIPARARLRFDVSWMFDRGDGAWAEARLRVRGEEVVVYHEYMKPDPKSLLWREVIFDMSRYAGQDADLVLRCYNKPGGNTIADWLNWRDIVIEAVGGRQ
jgi:hypothetical protein